MRRVGCWYFKKASGTRGFREAISRAEHPDEVKELILNFPIEIDTGDDEVVDSEGDCEQQC